MRRGATREEIIRTMQDLIRRNGIRAVRVDEIAATLGISKRTLYEKFSDKNDLVMACLCDMSRQQQEHIAAQRAQLEGNPLQKTLWLIREYVDSLYRVDRNFLADICKIVFADQYGEHREFWRKELTHDLDLCRENGLLLEEIDASVFADKLMLVLLELRLGDTTQEEVNAFTRMLLRGSATSEGIGMIDGEGFSLR